MARDEMESLCLLAVAYLAGGPRDHVISGDIESGAAFWAPVIAGLSLPLLLFSSSNMHQSIFSPPLPFHMSWLSPPQISSQQKVCMSD